MVMVRLLLSGVKVTQIVSGTVVHLVITHLDSGATLGSTTADPVPMQSPT